MAKTPAKRGRGRPSKDAQTPAPIVQSEPVAKLKKLTVPKPTLKQSFKILGVLVVVLVVGFLIWQYVDARNDVKRLSDPQRAGQLVNDELIDMVSKLTIVPSDEKPTIANVSDVSKLKDQPLFALAENDDKVLYYANARREIIYRPSTNQIITAVTLPAEDSSNTAQ